MKQFTTFRLGENLFGINVLLVREINRRIDVTPVDLAPDFVHGLVNLRGQIVTVLDIRKRLGITVADKKPAGTVILKTNSELASCPGSSGATERTAGDTVGFLVDEIGDMVTGDEMEVEPAPANAGGADGKYIDGVIKLEQDLLLLLKLSEVLQPS